MPGLLSICFIIFKWVTRFCGCW